jgi:hypothetical protein
MQELDRCVHTPLGLSTEHAGKVHRSSALESELGQQSVLEATLGAVFERGPELDSGQHGTPAKGTGHAYGFEGVGGTTASAWLSALAGTTVRNSEGGYSAAHAVE